MDAREGRARKVVRMIPGKGQAVSEGTEPCDMDTREGRVRKVVGMIPGKSLAGTAERHG